MHYAIIGGGIGGLTLAIALQKKNINVTVYESAPQWKPSDSWQIGKMAQWQNPVMTSLRNVMLSMTPKRITDSQFKLIYDVSLK